jgi:hypothetical protein
VLGHRVGVARVGFSPAVLVSWLVAFALAAAVSTGALWAPSAGGGATAAARVSGARGERGLSALPVAARGPVSAALGSADPAYRISGSSARNPAQRLRLAFTRAGVSIGSGSGRAELSLTGVGRRSVLRALPGVTPRARGSRVVYAWPGIQGWYANGPLGLEQGFTVARPPTAGVGPLVLSLSLAGNLRARLDHGSVRLSGVGVALRYDGLSAFDARGRAVRSWLALRGGRLLIELEDRGAMYPLRIDPLIQQGTKLVGTGAAGNAAQGVSVALSADGSTALIGGLADNSYTGAAWVFTRSGATWTQQGPKLFGTGGGDEGDSVALSGDGSTALIGGSGTSGGGAAWVFTRSGTTWTEQAKLFGTGAVGFARQGESVALSADGSTALIGGPLDNSHAGAAWVFTRSGSSWTQQGLKLVGTGPAGNASQGVSVALSGDGSTALIGGSADSSYAGAAWVFARSGTTWTQQGAKLVGSGAVGSAEQGSSVALAGDGSTALIGGIGDNSDVGAAWVFTRSGTTWMQQGGKLIGSGAAAGGAGQGQGAALSGDGSTALIGGSGDNSDAGAAWVFTRSGTTWTQQGAKLVGSSAVGSAQQGYSVALSGDGGTALLGGFADNAHVGAAWVFVNPATLTVTEAGTGSGSVSSADAQIDCGATCSHTYTTGTTVTLSATAAAGSVFAGWTGGGCAGTGTCTITLSADTTVTATFTTAPPPPPPGTDTLTVVKAGTGTGTLTSGDGQIGCGATCSHAYTTGTMVTLSATAAAGSTFAGWTGGGCAGAGACTITLSADTTVTATFATTTTTGPGGASAPASITVPSITGTPSPGKALSCSTGTWSGSPTTFAYQWNRDGTPIAGATNPTYVVQTLDEGSTLTCTVTASNPTARASATSPTVSVAVPFVRGCPAASGRITGVTLGLIGLGMTRSQAHHAYRHSSTRGSRYKDFFCLTPRGVRVGYASPKLLHALTPAQRKHLHDRVVWASTANPYYAIDAIRPGSTLTLAAQRFHTSPRYRIGLNDWYLGTYRSTTVVLKVRQGIIQEIGITDKRLTTTPQAARTLLSSFY